MTIDYQMTEEQEAHSQLLVFLEKRLSEAARTLFDEAHLLAYKEHRARGYGLVPQEYEEAYASMHLAAAKLTDYDRKALARVVNTALAAAASVALKDKAFRHVWDVENCYWYYRDVSKRLEEILREVMIEEHRQSAKSVDPDTLPF